MDYTIIVNGQSYDLPKKTMKVVEEMDRVSKVDSISGMSIRDKFKKLFDFITSLVGKEHAIEILGSEDINDVDLSDVTITFKKIMDAYSKPIDDYDAEKRMGTFDGLPVEDLVRVADAAEKIARIPTQK